MSFYGEIKICINIWNTLPDSIASAKSVSSFKRMLHKLTFLCYSLAAICRCSMFSFLDFMSLSCDLLGLL